MKHIFIINPTAGKSDSRQKIYDMAEKLRQEHGLEVQCLLTKKQGHATEIARRLREGEPVGSMHDIRGTMYAVPTKDTPRWPTASSATTMPP